MRHYDNPQAIEKQALQESITKMAIALLGFLFISSVVSLVFIFITGADSTGIIYLISSLLGLVFIWLYYRKELRFQDILFEKRDMPKSVLISGIIVTLGALFIYSIMDLGLKSLFNGFNYTLEFTNPGTIGKISVFYVLDLILVKPFIEELLFRGILLRSLQIYGRNFAMVITAIMFACYQSSFDLLIYSFILGIIFSYITIRYSIKWAMVLHCIANAGYFVITYFTEIPYYIDTIVLGIFFLMSLIVLLKDRGIISKYKKKGRSLKNAYNYAFSNLYIYSFLAIALFLAVLTTKITSIYA